MKKGTGRAYIALGIVSVLWGTTYIASRISVHAIPGLFVSGIRQFVSGTILVSYFLLKGFHFPDWQTIKKISFSSLFLLCISNGLLTWSLEYIGSGMAAIIAGLVPLFITLFSIWLLKFGRLTRWIVIGLFAGFAGIVTIFYDYLDQLRTPVFAFGISLSFLATLSWSYGSVYSAQHKLPTHILFGVGIQMLIAGCILLSVCLISGKYVNLANANYQSLYALLYLIIFGSLITYSAYVFAINKLPPALVSLYAYINPVVAIGLGWLLLDEKINGNMIAGSMITLVGVYLVNREFKKQRA
jgi:drug/metabolite transporter (DMT)-like permease